jgi:CRISPR type III-A-associated RAMP protein Csm4
MNPGLVVKLRPSGPWRIGPDSGARNRVDVIYHSDSLYSAVTAAMSRLGWLEEWLDATARTGSPAVSFSSCFPYLDDVFFVIPPRTVWPPPASSTRAARVRWKSARFVPLTVVQSILTGRRLDENQWSVDGSSDCLVPIGKPGPFRTAVRSNAGVDRLTGASERHSTACIEFRAGSGLWTVVSFAGEAAQEKWSGKIKAAFRLLADSGFGGERSRGWGRSETPEFTEGMLPDLILPFPSESAAATEPVEVIEAALIAPPAIEPLVVEPEPEPPAGESAVLTSHDPERAVLEPEAPAPEAPASLMSRDRQGAAPLPDQSPGTAPEEPPSQQSAVAVRASTAESPAVETVPEAAAEPPSEVVPVAEAAVAAAATESSAVEAVAEAAAEPAGEAVPIAESAVAADVTEWPAPESPAAVEAASEAVAAAELDVAAAATESPAPEAPAAMPQQPAEAFAPAPAVEPEPIATEPEAPVAQPEPERLPPVAAPAHPHWLLSLFTPAPADSVDWRRGNYTVVPRGGRVESPAGSGELKKQIQMVAEGSVVYAETPPRGSAADVAPDGFAHPVFRAGFAVAIPLPEVR